MKVLMIVAYSFGLQMRERNNVKLNLRVLKKERKMLEVLQNKINIYCKQSD